MFGIGSDHETDAYEDYEARGDDEGGYASGPRVVSCKHCHKGGMFWAMVNGKWRMKDEQGNVHSCLTEKAAEKALAFKKKSSAAPQLSLNEINGMLQIAALEDKRDNYSHQ